VAGDPEPKGQKGRFLADVLTFGWVLPAAIATGAGIGWLLDRLFSTFPILTLVFGLVGFAGGIRQLSKEADSLAKGNGPDRGGDGG